MVNGLGVLGWGVGGIEAEAAMLGQPMSMLMPQVLGFRLHGELPEGATATDLVLTVTEMLRERGVVGKFVEFYGAGLAGLPIADRATIGNMSPEFGSTCAIFPIDAETLDYLGSRPAAAEQIELVEAYAREQGLWHDEDSEEPTFSRPRSSSTWATWSRASPGPRRPQDRVPLRERQRLFRERAGRDYAATRRRRRRRPRRGRRRVLPRLRPARPTARPAPREAPPRSPHTARRPGAARRTLRAQRHAEP